MTNLKHNLRKIAVQNGVYPYILRTKLAINKLRYKYGEYHIGDKDYTLGIWPRDNYEKIIALNGEMELPRYFVFEPTMRCNLTCDFCYQKDSRALSDKHELTFEQVCKIIDNLGDQVKHMHLIGSEIFMRRDIIDIIEYLNKKGIPCSLGTNGTLITEKMAEQLAKMPNLTMVWVSIDGLEELHNKLRGSKTAFQRSTRALKRLSRDTNVGVNTVVMDTNLYQLKELVPLMKELGVPQITFELEMFTNKEGFESTKEIMEFNDVADLSMLYSERSRPKYDIGELKQQWNEILKLGKELGVVVEIKPPVAVYHDTYYSGEARDHLTLMCRDWALCRIDCKGNVILCSILKKQFGNLLEKPLNEIWNSDEFKRIRMKMLTNNMTEVCKRCEKLCHVPGIGHKQIELAPMAN